MKKKSLVIAAAVLVALIAVALVCVKLFAPKPVEGAKAVTISVIDKNSTETRYEVHTDAEFLRGAMEEAEGLEFSGTESDYGLMVETVNGVTPDFAADGAYWAFYIDLNNNGVPEADEYCQYGVDSQPINDGEAYIIIYEVYEAA